MLSKFNRAIKRTIINALSLDRMSDEYIILTVNYVFLIIYATLESVFVNTLLYRITPEISIVIIYRAITYIVAAVTMNVAAFICHKKSPVLVVRLGALFYLLMYASLFFGMGHFKYVMYLTAILSGLGGAFYWCGHNTLVPHYTTIANRDLGVSIICLIQGVAVLFVPIITGFVISSCESVFGSINTGYRFMFGVCMLVAAIHVYYQRKIPPVTGIRRESQMLLALKLLYKKKLFKMTMAFETLRGFRDGTFAFILNMILFEIITSESLVGVNAFLTGIASISGAFLYGKVVIPRFRARYSIIATTVMSVSCSLMLFNSSIIILMLFAVINSFFSLFVTNSAANTSIDLLTHNSTYRKCSSEGVAIREFFLATGRVAGLYVFILFPSNIHSRIMAMLTLTLSQYILSALVWVVNNTLTNKKLKISESNPV